MTVSNKVKARDLRLGDCVAPRDIACPFNDCVVTQIKDGEVYLFRPYARTADFEDTGGVIPYIGIETYSIPADDREVTLWSRKELR